MKTPLRTIPEQRKVRELPRKMNIEEVEELESTKIYIQNPSTPAETPPKLRKFTYKTNMQARKHVNSDEFRPAPRSSTPACYYYRIRTPVLNTLFGEKLIASPSQVGSLLPNTLNEEMSRDEIRKVLINVQLTEYAMFLQSDSDNLAAKDRIKALIRSSQTPEKLRKASVNLQKLSHSLQSGVNYGSSACI